MRRKFLCCIVVLNMLAIPAASAAGSLLEREEGTKQLIDALYGHANLNGKSVFQMICCLWELGEKGVNPGDALTVAAERSGHLMPDALRLQLLADWRIASENGLLTTANLDRMRRNLPPHATAGRYIGQLFGVILIDQGGADVIANMMLCAAGQAPLPGAVADPSYVPPNLGPLAPRGPTSYSSVPRAALTKPGYIPLATPPANTSSSVANLPAPAGTPVGDKARLAVVDLPVNGLLPTDGRIKLGIARVTDSEIEASLIGESMVNRNPNAPGRGGYLPTVRTFKVPKTVPVRLPGISANAYLILNLPTMQFYYIDATANNGGSYRIAMVASGP